MDKREKIQASLTDHILTNRYTILLVSIRLGKTKVALDAIEEKDSVLVVYPFASIKDSWVSDIKKFPPKSGNITFTTIQSLSKLVAAGKTYSYVIVDEPQKCKSPKQIQALKYFRESSKKFVGLTGTLNSKTQSLFQEELNWNIGVTYSIADAIKDGLVKNYRVFVHYTTLDKTNPYVAIDRYGKPTYGTEAYAYMVYSETMKWYKVRMSEFFGRPEYIRYKIGHQKYMGLRTNLLLNSIGLLEYANDLVNSYRDRKALIYTLRTDIADKLSSQTFHSKNKDSDVLETFKESTDGHLAVVNAVQAGITIKKLSTVIFHSYDSNTETLYQKLGRSLLYEFVGDISNIHLVCLKDTNMEEWVDEACSSLEQEKIQYVFGDMIIPKIEYLKQEHPKKKLYFYKGKVVYSNGIDEEGRAQYSFLKSPDKGYPIKQSNLIAL